MSAQDDVDLLAADLRALSAFGADGAAVTRVAWTRELAAAYDWLADRCRSLGLDVATDAAGNLVAKWNVGTGPAIVMGSHIDTVPHGGHYDGALGVIGGLHAIRMLKARNVVPTRPVWLVAFMDEENTRFGTALFGSRAFAGEDMGDLADRRDRDGVTLATAMRDWDRELDAVFAAHAIDQVGTYLELHIEQGPQLETEAIDAGVVTSIVGIVGYRVIVSGQANHAGTTPMHLRRDALAGAARIVLAVRELARARPGSTTNVGVLTAEPGGSNVVPGRSSLTLDLRFPTDDGLAELEAAAIARVREICEDEQLDVTIEPTYRIPAAPMDPALIALIEQSARLEEATVRTMPSGAGHDAMVMARHVPTAMVFVPSRGGISHSPDEFTSPEHCALGARILARTVTELVS
jgi:hydantoinase/carbamoylase family amidase